MPEREAEKIAFSRTLRQASTDAEGKLWSALRNRKLDQHKFRRQFTLGPYVLDFYCPALRLAVEVDGGQHLEAEGLLRDKARTAFLQSKGVAVFRYTNLEVLQNLPGVVEALLAVVKEREEGL